MSSEWKLEDGFWTNGELLIQLSIETITPGIAKDYLLKNKNFRKRTEAHFRDLTEKMPSWMLNGESIVFDADGNLLDGQHRLAACIAAKCSFDTVCVRGVSPDADRTLNSGKKRSLREWLAHNKENHADLLATSLSWLSKFKRSEEMMNRGIGIDAAQKLLDSNPSLRNSVRFIAGLSGLRITQGLAASIHYLIAQKSPAAADKFWALVASDAHGLPDDPARRLRELILNRESGQAVLRQSYVAAVAVIAVNNWLRSRPVKTLRWIQVGPNSTPFPKLDLTDISPAL